MQIEVFSDADTVAREAARYVAEYGREAIEARGQFTLALSGGSTRGRCCDSSAPTIWTGHGSRSSRSTSGSRRPVIRTETSLT